MTLVRSADVPPSSPSPPPGRGSNRRVGWGAIVVAAIAVTVVTFGLASFGKHAVYALVGVTAVVFLLWSIRDLIGPPIAEALRRSRPRPLDVPALGRGRTILGAGVTALAAGVLAFTIVGAASKIMYALVALVALAAGLWILWPAILLLFDTPPDEYCRQRDDKRRFRQAQWAEIGLGAESSRQRRAEGQAARGAAVLLTVLAAGSVAFIAAKMGPKALLVLVGGVILVAALLRARDKTLFAVFGTVCSLTFLVHKSFGPIDTSIAGGAPSIYITSFDAMLILLYALWVREGTFLADVRAAFHRRILWVPLVALLLTLASLLAPESSLNLVLAELMRMSWMYLLFFYIAVRVRTRAMVWAVLAGFGAFAIVEIAVCLLQWKTGGVLGLSFLGVPTQLTLRVTDTSELGRPFGTIIHPDFMAAAMGSLGFLAFALGLSLRRSLCKVAGFGLFIGCVLCLYLAHTRSAFVGLVIALVGMVVVVLIRGQLQWRTVGKAVLVLIIGVAIFFPQLQGQIANNIGTAHFGEEVASRVQLNDVAEEMFANNPIIGVGLNNFQNAMGPYEEQGVIFIDNPVQDLYLLYLSEAGILGMAGFVLIGISMFSVAFRLATSRDRFFGGIGLGISAAMTFLVIEELLDFALREDVPLAVYWIFAGLAVACCRMAGLEGRRTVHAIRPGGLQGGASAPRSAAARSRVLPRSVPASPAHHLPRIGDGSDAARVGPLVAIGAGRRLPRQTSWSDRPFEGPLRTEGQPLAAGRELSGSGRDKPTAQRHVHRTSSPLRSPRARRGRSRAVLLTGERATVGTDASRVPRRRRHVPSHVAGIGRLIIIAPLLVVLLLGTSTTASATSLRALAATSPDLSHMQIVFAAESNGIDGPPGVSGIFEANADGSDLTTLVQAAPGSDTVYDWPQWALGGTKIIYTVRNGPPTSGTDPYGSYENIWEMDPNGSNRRQLTNYNFRAVQPKVSANGRSVIFNAQNPQYPADAIYKLNLLTLQATNLSEVTQPNGALDVDPEWTSNGEIIFASTEAGSPGEAIEEMNANGTDRRVLISDGDFNTDPALSPNRDEVADSAFEGSDPAQPGTEPSAADLDETELNPQNWIVEVVNQATGATTALTDGDSCLSLTVTCLPGQSSGWQPTWSPDGEAVAWIGRLNGTTSCICAANADGSDPQVLIQSDTEDITWFDWTAPGGTAPSSAVTDARIGARRVSSRLLLSAENLVDDQPEILDEPADMMGGEALSTGTASDPIDASWSEARSEFVFVGNAPYDASDPRYGPPPPRGQHVRVHFTLREINPSMPDYSADEIPATEQVFLHGSNGTVVQLTTPWTEDWRDAIEPGDARANTNPVISPNGEYVVFTNHSSLTGESFLLRMNLKTGAVLNLTNGTAGAMEVNDALPAFSPDGSKIAFTWTDGADTDVYVMNASNGRTVTRVTDDNAYDMDPTWSPDGKSIVFSRYNGRLDPTPAELDSLTDLPATRWSLVKVDLATGNETVLTTPSDSPTWRPVYSPDGRYIDFIGLKYGTKGVFRTTPSGARVEPVLVMPDINVTSVDWR